MKAHLSTASASLAALLTIAVNLAAAPPVAAGTSSAFDVATSRRVDVELASSARASSCSDDTRVTRELTVCSMNGCETIDVSDQERFSFMLERGSQSSFELGASTVYAANGVVTGDSVADVVRGSAPLPEKLTQSVAGKGKCIFSFSYRIHD